MSSDNNNPSLSVPEGNLRDRLNDTPELSTADIRARYASLRQADKAFREKYVDGAGDLHLDPHTGELIPLALRENV